MVAGGTFRGGLEGGAAVGGRCAVDVYAEEISAELRALVDAPPRGSIMLHRRAWIADDLGRRAVAVGAFDDEADAASFAAGARDAGVPVNVIDKPAFCDFAFGAIVNRSPLVIGISTDGAAPVFAQAIRAKLETLLPKGFAVWAAAAQSWRSAAQGRRIDVRPRGAILAAFRRACRDARRQRADRRTSSACGRGSTALGPAVVAARYRSSTSRADDPELLTMRAVRALQSADMIVFDGLISPAVLDFARREARKLLVGEAGFGTAGDEERDHTR